MMDADADESSDDDGMCNEEGKRNIKAERKVQLMPISWLMCGMTARTKPVAMMTATVTTAVMTTWMKRLLMVCSQVDGSSAMRMMMIA